jgi:hypothetical protein
MNHSLPSSRRCQIARSLSGTLIGFALLFVLAQPVLGHDVQQLVDLPFPLDGLTRDIYLCEDDFLIEGTGECTHGPDPVIAEGPNVPVPPITCDGDGVSGPRVQVLYIRELLTPDRYEESLATIRHAAAGANRLFDESAHLTGGHRHIRFVTTPSCEIDVQEVVVLPLTTATLSTLIIDLKLRGYEAPNRKYLMFVDAQVYCGIATIISDSSPGEANSSNLRTGYARVDKSCWYDTVVAHELVHNLGGVQRDTPNASGGWHCIDAHDVMCYSDPPHYPSMQYLCAFSYYALLDCNHDDYFHVNPPPDSYLATHWNVADSVFLFVHNLPPTISLRTASDAQTFRAPATITVLADATDSDGTIDKVEFYVDGGLAAVVAADPYQFVLEAPSARSVVVTAIAYDDDGETAVSAPLILVVEEPNLPPAVTLRVAGHATQFTAPADITLIAEANDSDGSVVRVEFYAQGKRFGEATDAPYQITWQATITGTYSFIAIAFDDEGASVSSSVVTIIVASPPNQPPTVSLSVINTTQPFTAPVTVQFLALATDSDGSVAKVEFLLNDFIVAEGDSAPYRFTHRFDAGGEYTIRAIAHDDKGLTTLSAPLVITVVEADATQEDEPSWVIIHVELQEPGAVILTVTLSGSPNELDRVEFYNGQTRLSTHSSPPYRYVWQMIEPGSYFLTARAVDRQGRVTSSLPHTLIIPPTAAPEDEDDGSETTLERIYLPLMLGGDSSG